MLLFLGAGFFALLVSKPPLLDDVSFSQAVYDRNNNLLRLTLSEDEKYRLLTPISEISPYLIEATLLKEDKYFRFHPGFNPIGLIRAVWQTYIKNSRRTGGSTITMQLARIRYGINSHTIPGKLVQIIRAFQLEWHYSKDEILEAYLNLVPYGWNIEGVGAASLVYFKKNSNQLNVLDALSLVVIPQNPVSLTPRSKPAENIIRPQLGRSNYFKSRNILPGNNSDFITARNYLYKKWIKKHPEDQKLRSYLELPVDVHNPSELPFIAPHFVDGILQSNLEEKIIITTLDSNLQALLERHSANYIDRHHHLGIHNTSAMLIDFLTMEVKAVLGSVDFFNPQIDGQVDGTRAKRSPGSLLKPFIYALAMDKGIIHPYTMLKDTPQSFGAFNPENFDNDFVGPIKAKHALIRSRNVPAVWLVSQLGSSVFYNFLKQSGVSHLREPSFYGLAGPVLGGIELTMEELVTLYAMIARGGELRQLRKTLKAPVSEGVRLLSNEAAFLTLDILKNNPPPKQEDIAKWVRDPLTVSWKTGTSYAFRDAWAVAVFGDYILAIWIGNFNGQGNAAFIGRSAAGLLLFEIIDSIKSLDRNIQDRDIEGISNLIEVEVCALSGHLPGPHCPRTISTWFIPGKSPIKTCDIHRKIFIDPGTGLRVPFKYSQGARSEIYEFWPSDLLLLFKQAGIPRRVPPPFDPKYSFETRANKGIRPKITSPSSDVIYNLRAGSIGKEKIPLQAVADADVYELYWFIDEKFIGKAVENKPLFWSPEVGKFIIRVVDDQGRSDALEVVITVVK